VVAGWFPVADSRRTAERAKKKVKAKAVPLLIEADFTFLFYLFSAAAMINLVREEIPGQS
jgi:hypothetical protein